MGRSIVENALIQVGLPVKCRWQDCPTTGFAKPKCVDPTNGGWYKGRERLWEKRRWYCPEHSEEGRNLDERFREKMRTPEPLVIPASAPDVTEELYKLLDE